MDFDNKLKPIIEKPKKVHKKNKGMWENKPFWIGVVDLLDGHIEATYPYELAKANDFHHSFYMDSNLQERIENNQSGVFWYNDDGSIETYWRNEVPENIVNILKGHLKIK